MNAFALLEALGDSTSSFQDRVRSKETFTFDLLDHDEFLNEIIAQDARLLSLYAHANVCFFHKAQREKIQCVSLTICHLLVLFLGW